MLVNYELKLVKKWLDADKLALNVDKTMLFFVLHQKISRLSFCDFEWFMPHSQPLPYK